MPETQEQERAAFFEAFPVPYETRLKLERYAEILLEKTEQFNLIAPSTWPHIWTRHFLDSAQLYPLLPAGAERLVDLGSGAGFPGLVLSLLGVPEVHLIESIGKKARFLQEVVDELGLSVTVHNARIEAVKDLKADIVTARALTSLPDLLNLAQPFLKKDALAVFLKGQKADAELTEAAKYRTFTVEKKQSRTDSSGVILILRDLKTRHDAQRRRRKK